MYYQSNWICACSCLFCSVIVCLYICVCACLLQNNMRMYNQINIHGSEVHCGSAFEPGGSGLPYYCTPPVRVPAVLCALAVWRLSTKKNSRDRRINYVKGGPEPSKKIIRKVLSPVGRFHFCIIPVPKQIWPCHPTWYISWAGWSVQKCQKISGC